MKPYFAWLVIVGFSTLVVGGFAVARDATFDTPLDIALATTTSESMSSATATGSAVKSIVPEGYKEYRSDAYHFSVHYPGDIPPQESYDRLSFTVEFQNEDGDPGFEIYVALINGTTITEDRFLRDAPSGVRKDEKKVAIDGLEAMVFHGFNARVGQTYEVWFIKDCQLYEVSTYKQLEPWLNEILTTWRFI